MPAIARNGRDVTEGFIWPSYVEDIMGPMCFDFGYGPFRWVCLLDMPLQMVERMVDDSREFPAWMRNPARSLPRC